MHITPINYVWLYSGVKKKLTVNCRIQIPYTDFWLHSVVCRNRIRKNDSINSGSYKYIDINYKLIIKL